MVSTYYLGLGLGLEFELEIGYFEEGSGLFD